MNDRLFKMFEESKKRHQNDKLRKATKVKEEPTENELKNKRAKSLLKRYNSIDKDKFGKIGDLDYKWIVNNIFNSNCEYCGENDWHSLGCDRVDNSKGHTKDNCICACKRCNIMRGNRFSVEDMKEIGEVIKRLEFRDTVYKIAKKRGKKVAKLDKDGNIVKVYPAVIEVKADGYDRTLVGKAANHYIDSNGRDYSIYKDYYWEFID